MGNVGVGGIGVWVVKCLDGWRLAAFFMTGESIWCSLISTSTGINEKTGSRSIPYSSHHVRVRHSCDTKVRRERTNIDFIHQI